MIISLIFFIGSGLFLALIWYGKRSELNGGRSLIHIGSESRDAKLHSLHERSRAYLESIDSVFLKDKFHTIAEKSERLGLKVAEKAVSRFGKVRDTVSGKNIPKNRGLISFVMWHDDFSAKEISAPKNTTKKGSE